MLWIMIFSCYCLYAAIATTIGPTLPNISREFSLTPDIAGAVVALYSLGGMLAFIGGWISDKVGRGLISSISLTMMGVSSLMVSMSPSFYLLGLSLLLIGIGGGIFEAASNAMVSDLYIEKRGMAVNLLHIAWNIGSGFGPPLIAFIILSTGSWRLAYLVFLPLLFPLAVSMYVSSRNLEGKNPTRRLEDNVQVTLRRFLIMLPITSIAISIIAVELGLSSWLPSILYDMGASLMEGGLTVGLFWGLMGVGRIVWALFTDRLGYLKSLLSSSTAGVFSISLAALPISIHLKMAFWAVSGFFFAPLYPTLIAWITALNPNAGGAYTGILFTFGTIGSFISTWLIGVIIKIWGAIVAQYFLPLIGFIMILNILIAKVRVK
jgi:MFS family permease